MEQTKVMERFPFPVWEWSRQMQDILYNYPHRAEDFAKSYSRNQFIAKTWMIEVLKVYADIDRSTKCWVMGSWYGTLTVPLITTYFYPKNQIHLVDFDEEALEIAEKLHGKYTVGVHHIDVNWDMERLSKVKADIWINTSCEHMYPMWKWRELNAPIQKNPLLVLQSSNDDIHEDHINCVQSEEELIDQARIKHVIYSGARILPNKSTRFMVIGR